MERKVSYLTVDLMERMVLIAGSCSVCSCQDRKNQTRADRYYSDEQEVTATAVYDRLVIHKQEDAAAAVYDRLFLQKQEDAATAVYNRLVTQRQEDAATAEYNSLIIQV